jgi:hypothetical protein
LLSFQVWPGRSRLARSPASMPGTRREAVPARPAVPDAPAAAGDSGG